MNERDANCLNQYDLQILNIKKVRGALLCETDQGLMLFKECPATDGRIAFEDGILSALEENPALRTDRYIPNREGQLVSREPGGGAYVLKRWYPARECDVREPAEVKAAVKALALLHRQLRAVPDQESLCAGFGRPDSVAQGFEKHERELHRVKLYIRKRRRKTEFESLVLDTVDDYLGQAERALRRVRRLGEDPREQALCHGDYNHHHILFGQGFVLITEFHRMRMGFQVADVYTFVRKIMEKHRWNLRLAQELLQIYEEEAQITAFQRELLYLMFLFPEKYWKQVNYYFNSNKAWMPDRNLQKMKTLQSQEADRQVFLHWLEGCLS